MLHGTHPSGVRLPTSKGLKPQRRITMRFLSRLIREEQGQDMVEYALLAAFISIVAIVTIRNIGPLVDAVYQNVQAALT